MPPLSCGNASAAAPRDETGFCYDSRPTNKGSGWNKNMDHEIHEARYQEIEPGILVLGAAYAASLLGMIFWVMA